MSDDPFCPRHGRESRPALVEGLRCDCGLGDEKCGVRECPHPAVGRATGIVPVNGRVCRAEFALCQAHLASARAGELQHDLWEEHRRGEGT